jgi:xylulokinase
VANQATNTVASKATSRATDLVVGLDIGTSSTKAVAVDANGTVVAARSAPHGTSQPRPGWFEQDAEEVWWRQPSELLRSLLADERVTPAAVRTVGVSGLGPCLLACDQHGSPLRPAILYGIDMRATAEVAELTARFGAGRILARAGSALSSQAVGPKLLWLQRHEPEVWARTARWFSASSFLVERLTGEYLLDHHTASQFDPMYDIRAQGWAADWAAELSPGVALPRLAWPGEIAGQVTTAASAATGLPAGTPVLAGTVDAWAEAHSVGVRRPGDLMIMYGSTLFMVGVDPAANPHPGLWLTAGLTPGTGTMAAGMATSGLVANWVADTAGQPAAELIEAAGQVAPGACGLAMLPYFAGERSPLFDPGARGVVAGLTLAHTPAHLMRAALEGVAMGVRHNLEAFDSVTPGESPWRAVAVGGGVGGGAGAAGGGVAALWPQIVSDVCGRAQDIPAQTVGASYGDALLAAAAVGLVPPDTDWTEIVATVQPRAELADLYDERYAVYRELYETTRPLISRLRA